MILGIVGIPGLVFFGTGIVAAVLAVIFGFIGRSRVRRGEATNPGQALTGLILGFVGIALFIGFIVLVVVASRGGDGSSGCFGNCA